VCDEPTGDLDRKTADEILGLLQVLNREHGKTIIMVTHDPKAAEYAARTVHLDKGPLVDAAPAHCGAAAMTRTGCVLARLFHRQTRTSLTLLSVVAAFVLFGLLQALSLVFSGGADFVGATRLVVQSRVSFTQSLPLRMVPEL